MSILQNYLIKLYHEKAPILKSLILSFFNRNKDRIKLIFGLFLFYLLIILIDNNAKKINLGLGVFAIFGIYGILVISTNIISFCKKNKNFQLIPLTLNTGGSACFYYLFFPDLIKGHFHSEYFLFLYFIIFCIQFFYTFIKQSLKINFLSFLALLLTTYLMTGAF